MFIVTFAGGAPKDKAEWIAILSEAMNGELGGYRVRLFRVEKFWRFTLDWCPNTDPQGEPVVANSPNAVAFNIYQMLKDGGKPVDPNWSP